MLHHIETISYLSHYQKFFEDTALKSRHFQIALIIVWVAFAVDPHVSIILSEDLD